MHEKHGHGDEMNYTQYFPMFKHPEITAIESVLHIPGILISAMNIFLISIFVIYTITDANRFHINFCILRIQMLGAFYFISIGRIALSSVSLITGKSSNNDNILWKLGIMFVSSIGIDLLRFLWITMYIERYIATVYSKKYEYAKKRFIIVPIVLTSAAISLTTGFAIARHLLNCNVHTIYAATFAIDLVTLYLMFRLIRYNRKLRASRYNSDFQLSQRYQIVENVRVLKLMLPIILFGVLYTSLGTFVRILLFNIPGLLPAYRYVILTYGVVLNCYILATFIIWIRNDEIYSLKFNKIFAKYLFPKISDSSNQQLILKNVEGQPVYTIQTMELHFSFLRDHWNQPYKPHV